MGFAELGYAWRSEGLTPVEKLVLLSFAEQTDNNGHAPPSERTAALFAGIDIVEVHRVRHELYMGGLIDDLGRVHTRGRVIRQDVA